MYVRKAFDLINFVTKVLVGLLVFSMVAVVASQVFFRYVLNSSLRWADEIARYLMIWMAFLGASLAVRYGAHISIEAFMKMMSPRVRRVVRIIILLVLILFLASLVNEAWDLTHRVWRQRAASISMSMGYVYIAAPIGFILMTINFIAMLLQEVFGDRPTEDGSDKETLW
jgi:TRAP-type C4-dicarboxylate transport system permease small subunit